MLQCTHTLHNNKKIKLNFKNTESAGKIHASWQFSYREQGTTQST
jgi:hypothetical protein